MHNFQIVYTKINTLFIEMLPQFWEIFESLFMFMYLKEQRRNRDTGRNKGREKEKEREREIFSFVNSLSRFPKWPGLLQVTAESEFYPGCSCLGNWIGREAGPNPMCSDVARRHDKEWLNPWATALYFYTFFLMYTL